MARPFLDQETEFRASMTESFAFEGKFGDHDYVSPGSQFMWPLALDGSGQTVDLRKMHAAPSSGYTAHLTDPANVNAFFVAFSKKYELAFGYVWKRKDFPWMGIWEGEPQPAALALEWLRDDAGYGIRCVVVSGVAPAHGGTWPGLWHSCLRMAARARNS